MIFANSEGSVFFERYW